MQINAQLQIVNCPEPKHFFQQPNHLSLVVKLPLPSPFICLLISNAFIWISDPETSMPFIITYLYHRYKASLTWGCLSFCIVLVTFILILALFYYVLPLAWLAYHFFFIFCTFFQLPTLLFPTPVPKAIFFFCWLFII